jgi:hypothetical protein
MSTRGHGYLDLKKIYKAETKKSSNKREIKVEIALPQAHINPRDVDRLQNAINALMEACEFEFGDEIERIQGSLYLSQIFKPIIERLSESAANKTFQGVYHAFKAHISGNINADVTGKIAETTAEVIKSLEPFDAGAIRIHQLLVVKITRDGKAMLRVETISLSLAQKLADNPMLLRMPDELWTSLDAHEQEDEPLPALEQPKRVSNG